MALRPDSTVRFFRIKNSWGALRPDRELAPGFPGYHDLYVDYLEGPVEWCPDQEDETNESCRGTTVSFGSVVLPPGYRAPPRKLEPTGSGLLLTAAERGWG